ncbi:hypothetical protein BDD12DRAFT_877352, partial [Trichophaea hybrida]
MGHSNGNPPPVRRETTGFEHNRHEKYLPDSNFQVLYSFLVDPTFVNLGEGQPGRIVMNNAAPMSGTSEADIEVRGGVGIAHTLSGPFKYDGGIIYGANDFVTLPQPLIDTLSSLGFTTFIDDIISSGLKKKLSDTPAVTVFTFANSSKTFSIDINEYTITGFLGYSPKLVDQRSLKNNAGKTLTFKYKHGSLFVNDTRV